MDGRRAYCRLVLHALGVLTLLVLVVQRERQTGRTSSPARARAARILHAAGERGRGLRRLHGRPGRGRHCFGAECLEGQHFRSRGADLVANRRRRDFRAHDNGTWSYACHGPGPEHRAFAVTLVSLAHGLPEEVLENITLNHLGWTARWGYEYCQFRGVLDWSRPAAWSKLAALAAVMACAESDWLMWMDIDAVFSNMSVSLPALLAAIDDEGADEAPLDIASKDAIFSRGFRLGGSPLNTGVFLLRNTPYSAGLLAQLYNGAGPEAIQHPWWENKAANDFFLDRRAEFDEHCAAVSPRWFNQHRPLFQQGDFVTHYAGMPNRYPKIMADLARARRGPGYVALGAVPDNATTLCGPFPRLPEAQAGPPAAGAPPPSRLLRLPATGGNRRRSCDAGCAPPGLLTLPPASPPVQVSVPRLGS